MEFTCSPGKQKGSRFHVNYREMNVGTVQDVYLLPRIDESLDTLIGSKCFSTLDLTSGYWQISLGDDA